MAGAIGGLQAGAGIEIAQPLSGSILPAEYDLDPNKFYPPGNSRRSTSVNYNSPAGTGNILWVLPQFFYKGGTITALRTWIGNNGKKQKQLIFRDSLVSGAHTPGTLAYSNEYTTVQFHDTQDAAPNLSVADGEWLWIGMWGETDASFSGGVFTLNDMIDPLGNLGIDIGLNNTVSPDKPIIGYKNALAYGTAMTVYPTPLTRMLNSQTGFPITTFKFSRS